MANYTALKNKQSELIRKALEGSAFLAPISAIAIADLTSVTGVAPNEVVDLAPLPVDYDDLGWLSTEGVSFAREVAQAEIASWGSVTPTRTDITSDSSTATVVCQETKLLTIGLATGADLAAITADPATGEVSIAKPARPSSKSYRLLTLAVDQADAGEIYIARFFPRAKVTNYAEQSFSGGDDPISWGVTFTGEVDSDLGYSERWIFGGAGWKALLTGMGITDTV